MRNHRPGCDCRMCAPQTATASERFWKFVLKTDGCWLWTGAVSKNGYGHFTVRDSHGERQTGAHRFAFEFYSGEMPPSDQHVCHGCDNRLCVRREHLFLGTPKDNEQDKSSKGRARNQNSGKESCVRGHVFTPENTIHEKRGGRQCRACKRLRAAKAAA